MSKETGHQGPGGPPPLPPRQMSGANLMSSEYFEDDDLPPPSYESVAAESYGNDSLTLSHNDPRSSMGGLLCAEVALIPSLADGSLRHRLIGTVNFDVPFLGMHPRVVKVGLASIFSPAPPKSPQDGDNTPSVSNMQTTGDYFDDKPSASTSTPSIKSPESSFSPSQLDPNYNPAFKNDVILPVRKGWEGAWYFLNKHSGDLRTATKQLVKSHLEFGGAMADYSGLKLRYTRIRGLEEQNERTRKAVIGSSVAPPRVRFVNYYTSSTGRPKKPKTPTSPEIVVETPPLTNNVGDVDHKTTDEDYEKYSGEFSPRDDRLLETDDDIKEFEAAESIGAVSMDHLEPAPMSDIGGDSSDIESWVDATENMEIAPSSSKVAEDATNNALKPEQDLNVDTAPSEKSPEVLTSGLEALPPVPDLPAKPEKPPFFADKETRKLAEKEYDRVLTLYFRAVKDREKALRDREKLEKKRERRAIKEGKKAEKEIIKSDKSKEKDRKKSIQRRETDHESSLVAEQREAQKEWKDAMEHSWNNDDSTIEPLSERNSSMQSTVLSTQSTRTPSNEEQKPFKDRTFCTLPPKDGSGNRDPTWVRVLMKDVDLVEAHCGLFFPDPHDDRYEKLIGDSFFPQRTSPLKGLPQNRSPPPGDGFTSEELNTTMVQAPQDHWIPPADYDEYEIDSLVPGPNRLKVVGRIVNMFESSPKAKLPAAAKGAVHLVVKDATGAVTIRFAYTLIPYGLQIGQLVSVWATFVANGDRGIFPCAVAPMYIRIFPEKDKNCHIRLLDGPEFIQACRKPLDYQPTLMSLKDLVQGGSEVTDAKILVIVRSVSTRKRVAKKDGTTADLVKVGVMDDTSEAVLSLWGVTSASPMDWQPSQTALLISSPGLNVSHQVWLALTSNTFIDVNPSILEAERLRAFAGNMIKRQHINPAFPDEEYNLWSSNKPDEHVLYSLADVDNRAREAPEDEFEGYLSMIIMDLNMSTLRQQNMLMLYANMTMAKCKHCDEQVGKLIDESGCILSGKLLLSDHAWTRLLGRSAEEMVQSSASTLKSVEQRMLYTCLSDEALQAKNKDG
ncbi:hypothetical protein E4T49_08340 [Aureobasidium sp. EXF-10728]|nr:hypothetical protein E4T49_08340 [Aureobasidium sp. EXF-10728]